MPRFEPGTLGLWDQRADHYTITMLIWNGDKDKKYPKVSIEKYLCLARHWTAVFPPETKMALALYGRGNSPTLRVPLEAAFYAC